MSTGTDGKKACLLMFSGGYDTLLAPCYLVEKGYKVVLVTFDNGLEKNMQSVAVNTNRLIKLYGSRITSLGVKNITGIWRRLFLLPYLTGRENFHYKLKPMEMICLSCRTAMYVRSIAECLLKGIKFIAEGARESQGYPEQQRPVMDVYKELCNSYSIELLLPVYGVSDKESVKEELTIRDIVPKTSEPYCVFAMPLYTYKASKNAVNEMEKLLKKYLIPHAHEIIKDLPDVLRFKSGGSELA